MSDEVKHTPLMPGGLYRTRRNGEEITVLITGVVNKAHGRRHGTLRVPGVADEDYIEGTDDFDKFELIGAIPSKDLTDRLPLALSAIEDMARRLEEQDQEIGRLRADIDALINGMDKRVVGVPAVVPTGEQVTASAPSTASLQGRKRA